MIQERFPSEFLPTISDSRDITIATIYSTSIHSIAPYYKNSFCLSERFLDSFREIDSYFTIANLMKVLGIASYQVGLGDQNLLMRLCEALEISAASEKSGDCAVLIGNFTGKTTDIDVTISELQTYSTILFDDELILGLLSESMDSEDFYPIKMTVESNGRDGLRQSSKTIWVYSKHQSALRNLQGWHMEKNLALSNRKLVVDGVSDNTLRVEQLTGMLKATEKRVLFYKERIQELEEELKKYAEIASFIRKMKDI